MATHVESFTRSAMALAANPPKMTEWTAPMSAQASSAMASSIEMAINAVVAQVGLAAHKPLGVGQVPIEHLAPRLEPVQFFGDAGPKALGIVDRMLVKRFVFGEAFYVGL